MLHFLDNISVKNQGLLALLMGIILVLGALGKLGVLQSVLNTIMIAVGILLLIWGFSKSNILNNFKKASKK